MNGIELRHSNHKAITRECLLSGWF